MGKMIMAIDPKKIRLENKSQKKEKPKNEVGHWDDMISGMFVKNELSEKNITEKLSLNVDKFEETAFFSTKVPAGVHRFKSYIETKSGKKKYSQMSLSELHPLVQKQLKKLKTPRMFYQLYALDDDIPRLVIKMYIEKLSLTTIGWILLWSIWIAIIFHLILSFLFPSREIIVHFSAIALLMFSCVSFRNWIFYLRAEY